jgi:transcriptional regulator, propionate catabolism operon regulatory protein
MPAEVENKAIGGIITLQNTESVMKAENEIRRSMAKGLVAKYSMDEFIYSNPEMADLIAKAKKYAAHESTILITGPTGTGKEIMAHAIHQLSKRKREPFVSINCASIPEQLLESELFGYEEGSFTGARRGGKAGLFELAHKGTIFLDEIGSMPLSLQARLLRVLQEREVMRIGGDRLMPVDARVLAATNEDLKQSVLDGRFREDLFFRINVLSIYIPPLRERIQDIPPLIDKLLDILSRKHDLPAIKIPDSCIARLSTLPWPGNVRELSNFMERLIIICDGTFSHDIFEKQYMEFFEYARTASVQGEAGIAFPTAIGQSNPVGEAGTILKILQESKYNKNVAAQRLGISRVTLWRKMKKLPCL